MSPSTLMTAEKLLQLHIPDKRTELVRGILVVHEPPGERQGEVTANLTIVIGGHAKSHALGRVVAGDAGFKVASGPDTVRAPDVAFISKERATYPASAGYPAMAPDLAVEVLSPGDRPGEVLAKVADWLDAGSRLVWVVDPERRSARVYRADGRESLLAEADTLQGEDVLPGFACRLADVLPEPPSAG